MGGSVCRRCVALLAEGVGRNGDIVDDAYWGSETSPSSRRAWVEITITVTAPAGAVVALLAEGVGRNCMVSPYNKVPHYVALLAEGVGRNKDVGKRLAHEHVALLAEGVGRNCGGRRSSSKSVCRPPRGGRG